MVWLSVVWWMECRLVFLSTSTSYNENWLDVNQDKVGLRLTGRNLIKWNY